jgi:hypothetical protein
MNLALFFSKLVDESRVSQLYSHRPRCSHLGKVFHLSSASREQQKSAKQQVKSRTDRPDDDDDDLLINQLSHRVCDPSEL